MTLFQLVCQFTPTCFGENNYKLYRVVENNNQQFRTSLFPSSTLWGMGGVNILCRFEAQTFEGKKLLSSW